MADQMKIFLSHKGVDKKRVRLFNDVLAQLGFSPWLDEDAMPAGTELERGILQGFKDSCAAVFFVTPAFRDENYLATEVTYAIRQKREKGDRFAIIALCLDDHTGERGVIPELFRDYVWKEPESDIEALDEILRALPIQVGKPFWKGDDEPVPVRKKNTVLELSAKAVQLLIEAANDSHGHVLMTGSMHKRLTVSTNGKDLVDNDNPQNVAESAGCGSGIGRSTVD